jgi:uncharacterized OsmC-like protein
MITELDKKFLRGLLTPQHNILADEPISHGGSEQGPTPYDLLLMALGACTSMTLRMFANHKEWPLEDVDVKLRHDQIHAEDCESCEDGREGRIERIFREITLYGDLDEARQKRLIDIANHCPVHRTLENHPLIITQQDKSN